MFSEDQPFDNDGYPVDEPKADFESMIVWSVADDFKGWAPCACPGCPDEPIASYISVEQEFRGDCPVKIEVVNVPVCGMHADFAEEVLSDLAVVVGNGGPA